MLSTNIKYFPRRFQLSVNIEVPQNQQETHSFNTIYLQTSVSSTNTLRYREYEGNEICNKLYYRNVSITQSF